MAGAMRKIKICSNLKCEGRVNAPNAVKCASCGMDLPRNFEFLREDQIEERLHPKQAESTGQDDAESAPEAGAQGADTPKEEYAEFVTCPSCGRRYRYRVGLEICENADCGEYIGDVAPVRMKVGPDGEPPDIRSDAPVAPADAPVQTARALSSIDGKYSLQLTGDWMKFGRNATGKEYLQTERKMKVGREHAILRLADGAWYLSYCLKEDSNYQNSVGNPIYINGTMLGKAESYKLQPGDEIAFGEKDKSDPMAAFFRVE